MTYAVLVDTSAFYALQSTGDSREHALAAATAERFETDQALLVTTDYVLDETYTLLPSALGHRSAVRFGREIRRGGIEIVQVDPDIQEEAWRIFQRYADKDFSFTDCTSFAVMRRGKIGLAFTLDRHFRQFGFEVAPAS
ncbi:MAG: type II toxin-antitoxin system VapC family toxin, partial [Thermoanaerobaculia bacterium]